MKTQITYLKFAMVLWLACSAGWSARAGQYFQDFSTAAAGATTFGDGSQLFSTHLGSFASVQDATFKELQLTASGAVNTRSAFLLPDLDPDTPVCAFSAKWNSQVYGNFPGAADGFSFTFGAVGSLNLAGSYAQEDGYGTGISFGVRTFSGNSPGFYLRVNGAVVASQAFAPGAQWGTNNSTRHFFEVDWNYTNGVSVFMDGQPIFTNVWTPGFAIQPGHRFVWAARTGGLSQEVRLDNIVVVTGGNLVPAATTSPYYADVSTIPNYTAAEAFDGQLGGANYWATAANVGHVGATLSTAAAISAYVLVSSPSVRATDPRSWTLQGSLDNGTNWVPCGTGGGHFLNARESRAWLAANAGPRPVYRLNITQNNGNASTTLDELRFYRFNAVLPLAWTQTAAPAPVLQWTGIAGSTNLATLAAFDAYRGIYYSANFGATWTQSDAPYADWKGFASSFDGKKMVACAGSGDRIYVSTNSGVNWAATTAPVKGWSDVASSADGTRLVASVSNGGIWTSTNSGATWNQSSAPTQIWQSIAMSADGMKVVAVPGIFAGRIFVSADFGGTWTETSSPSVVWQAVCSSGDGTRLAAAQRPGSIHVSGDSGTTWGSHGSPGNFWRSLACSADGRKIVASAENSTFHVSADAGATWTQEAGAPSRIWDSIALSANGSRLVAVGPDIWTAGPAMPSAPTVTTLAASPVIRESATLNGTVNPNYAAASVWFNWGPTPAYGNTTPATQVGNGHVAFSHSALLSGLSSGTTLHFQIVSSNALGLTVGADMVFATPTNIPPTVTDLLATVTGTASTHLSAAVNPNAFATGAWFEWGTDTNYGNATAVQNVGSGESPVAISVTISNLLPIVYHGRAVATNSVGTSYTADVSFQVSGDRFNVVAPGNPVVATSTNFPSGNSAANAVDGRGFSKYENFDVLNTGFTVWASNTDSPVRALSLISANGPLDNDPDSYALYGSHDGSNFISIASGSVPLFVERSAIQSFSFANTTAYAAYKVIFPTVVSPDFVNSMQIAEVELLPYPEIIAGNGALTLSLPSGAALSALNGPASALLDRQLRFNANKIVVLDCTNSVTALITPTTGATIVKGIAIIGGNDSGVFPERTPSSVTLEGSNDGTNFFPLATFTPDLPVSGMQIQSRAIFANTSSYTQYRVTFGVPNSGSTLQIGELRLFGEPPVAAPALALHASGNNVIVRWPPALGFQLETKAALSQPAWIAVTNVPVFSDGMNTVTIPMDATTGFFRLKK